MADLVSHIELTPLGFPVPESLVEPDVKLGPPVQIPLDQILHPPHHHLNKPIMGGLAPKRMFSKLSLWRGLTRGNAFFYFVSTLILPMLAADTTCPN